jgi:hypothetical protein
MNLSPDKDRIYLFSKLSRPVLGSTQRVPRALSPGAERQRREADHSPPTNAEVEKSRSIRYA